MHKKMKWKIKSVKLLPPAKSEQKWRPVDFPYTM